MAGADEHPGGGGYAQSPSEIYPGGLCVHLEADDLAKLGLSLLPPVGEIMMIEAQVIVTNVHQNANPAGTMGKGLALQITHMGIEREGAVGERMAERLYGPKKEGV